MEQKIKLGDKVRVETRGLLSGRKGFETFEGELVKIGWNGFGYSGIVKTDDPERPERVYDTEVHKISLLKTPTTTAIKE